MVLFSQKYTVKECLVNVASDTSCHIVKSFVKQLQEFVIKGAFGER